MYKLYAIIIIILFGTILNAQNIATVHSSFLEKGYENILFNELTDANYKVDKYENINFDQLVNNINKYSAIVFVPAYNYSNSFDIGKYGKELKAYLEQGGLLVVSDANYPSQSDWISSIDPNLYWKASSQASKTNLFTPNIYAKDHPLLDLKVLPVLPWCKIDAVSREFKPLLTDYENMPVLAYKEIGKGILVVSSCQIGYNAKDGFPTVDFINKLIAWSKNSDRIKNITYTNTNIKKDQNVTIYNKIQKPQILNMYSVIGNKDVKTEVTIDSDQNNLNLTFKCYDKDTTNLISNINTRDGAVWNDDSIEIFIMPNKTYYHFAVNIGNTQMDEKVTDASYDAYWISKVKKEKNLWILNVSIPYVSMGVNKNNPIKNNLKINFGRNYHPGKPDFALCSWANLPEPAFHNTDYFETVKLNTKISNQEYIFTDILKLIKPNKITSNKNAFSVNTTNPKFTYKILDICCNKSYKSNASKKINIDFNKAGNHLLQGLLYSNNTLIASSNVNNILVPEIFKTIVEYPFYRNIIQSKDPNKEMSIKCVITEAFYNNLKLEYQIKKENIDKIIFKNIINVRSNDTKYIKYDLSKLNTGKYKVKILLKNDTKTIKTVNIPFEVLAPSNYEVTFDKKRICYVNGKPFFPILLYHAGEHMMNALNNSKSADMPKLEITSMLQDIKDHGFNGAITLFGEETFPDRYITNTQKAGMTIVPDFGASVGEDRLKKNIIKFNEYKDGLFYYTVDEPIGKKLQSAMDAYKILSQLDPHRPVAAAVNYAGIFPDANKAFDIMMPDEYLMKYSPEKNSIAGLLSPIKAAMEATNYQKPLWAVPQAFGNSDKRFLFSIPTKEEVRCQAYFYLLHGATGFAWYAFTSPEPDPNSKYGMWYLPDSDLWDEFKTLNSEIIKFSNVIIKGNSKGALRTNNELVHTNYWQIENTKYIIIVNPERTNQNVKLTMPSSGKLSGYFNNEKIDLNNNLLSLNLKPLECLILKLQ